MANYRFNPALLYGDPVAPMRSDYGGGSDITRLLMEQGRAQAEGALQRGQIWQNAIQQGAQQLAGGFQKAAEEKKMAKRDQAWLGLINDPESMKDPKTAYAKTVAIWGPEDGPKQFQALVGVHQLGQPKRDPEADHKALVTMGGAMAKMTDPGRAALWPQAKALTMGAFPELGKSLPDQYDPKVWAEQVGPLLAQMQEPEKLTAVAPGSALVTGSGKEVYKAEAKPEKPKSYEVTVPGPGGKPVRRLATEEEMRAGVTEYRAPVAPKEPDAAPTLTPAGLDMAAKLWATTGQMVPMGMGKAGAAVRQKIINRAAEMEPGADVAANRADYQADSGSLRTLQKQTDAVSAFEQTASKNSALLDDTLKKLPNAGATFLNRPLRSLEGALGSEDMAAFNTIRQSVANEYARIISNPSLAGTMSDSARHEADVLLNPDATPGQIRAALKTLQAEAANRHQSYQAQLGEIRGRRGGSGHGAAPTAPAAEGTPAKNPFR